MKLVTFKELCEMEEGAIFQSYSTHQLGEIMIFGGSLPENRMVGEMPVDFVQAPLLPCAQRGGVFGDHPKTLPDGSVTKADEFYLVTPSGYARWGLYDYSIRYLVWEREDRERLAQWLLFPLLADKEMNEDAQSIIKADERDIDFSAIPLENLYRMRNANSSSPSFPEVEREINRRMRSHHE